MLHNILECLRSSGRYSYAGCLRKGEGIGQNIPKAVSLFERLGEEGLLEAKVCTAVLLFGRSSQAL